LRAIMTGESRAAVEEANAEFYRALESGAIERMDDVWAHEEWVKCVHPGWDMIAGWPGVRESWVRIFESGQRLRASPADVTVFAAGDLAWVTCTENIVVFEGTSFDSAQAVATNLFVLRDGHWLMVHHHASPLPLVLPDTSSDIIQ
jgi:ketosteroid isomerase-like protein